MWDLPGPEIEPVSPALAGGFLTTVPPGKSLKGIFFTVRPKLPFGLYYLSTGAGDGWGSCSLEEGPTLN